MGLFDTFKEIAEAPFKAVGSFFSGDKGAMKAANEQIQAYRDMTRISQEEIARKRVEEASEKRRIEEKQIRGLRNRFRPAGFLNSASAASGATPVTDKLGG